MNGIKEYKVHWNLPVTLILAALFSLCLGIYFLLKKSATQEDQLIMVFCFVGSAYLVYKARFFWNMPIIVDDNSISFRGITIPFSSITHFTKRDPAIKAGYNYTPFGNSYRCTIESPLGSIKFLSGMFPQYEEIVYKVTNGSGVMLEALDYSGNKKEKSFEEKPKQVTLPKRLGIGIFIALVCLYGLQKVIKAPNAYNNRGNTYLRKGEYDRAIQNYNKAIRLNPRHAKAYNNRAIAYQEKSDYDRAIHDYSMAIKLDPGYADAYSNRAITYHKKGDYDRVIQDCNKAIELNPGYAKAYNNRGAAYHSKGNYDLAIQDFDKAIELDPGYAHAYYGRGVVYIKKGEQKRAYQDFDRAIELDPEILPGYNKIRRRTEELQKKVSSDPDL